MTTGMDQPPPGGPLRRRARHSAAVLTLTMMTSASHSRHPWAGIASTARDTPPAQAPRETRGAQFNSQKREAFSPLMCALHAY